MGRVRPGAGRFAHRRSSWAKFAEGKGRWVQSPCISRHSCRPRTRSAGAKISPVEVTTTLLERIEQLDSESIHSYALVLRERALDQAKAAEQEIGKGIWAGPLHGVPIAVKDLCNTNGVPTAAGTTLFRNWMPERNATVVDRLEQAGAVMLGKLKMTEGAYTTHHPSAQAPLNPWNAAHWVGSSSSGSGVATSAGLCYGSLGSDTGGSIRFPRPPAT